MIRILLAVVSVAGCGHAASPVEAPPRPRATTTQEASPRGASLAVGGAASCAIRPGGRVACWGSFGHPFEDDAIAQRSADPPSLIAGVDQAVELCAEGGVACARRADGTVSCWGDARFEARENEGSLLEARPVAGVTDAVSLACGSRYGCAVRSDGKLLCWGGLMTANLHEDPSAEARAARNAREREEVEVDDEDAEEAEVARRDDPNFVWPARILPWVPPAARVVAGSDQTWVHLRDGSVRAYGPGLAAPGEPIPDLASARFVAPAMRSEDGGRSTPGGCAVTGRGVVCWAGIMVDNVIFRVALEEPERVTALAVGHDGACAIRGGETWCWGRGYAPVSPQQAALAATDMSAYLAALMVPRRVEGIDDATEIAMSESHACVRRRQGGIACWGENDSGQLGAPPLRWRAEPQPITVEPATRLAAAQQQACALTRAGRIACWGRLGADVVPTPRLVEGLEGVTDLAVYDQRICALRADGGIACVSLSSAAGPATPVALPRGARATDLVLVQGGGGALLADGRVVAWRDGAPTATPLAGIRGATAVSAGLSGRLCALLPSGEVRCQTGDDGSGAPRPVEGLTDVVALAGTWYGLCAVHRDGKVTCTDDDDAEEIGAGLSGDHRIAVGAATMDQERAVCAWRPDGSQPLLCRPLDRFGPLAPVPGITAVDAAVGDAYACAVDADGRVRCWGSNRAGLLGLDPRDVSATPLDVSFDALP